MSAGAGVTCEELIRELPDFLDREVTLARGSLLERHLEECAHCLATYRFERGLLDRIRAQLAAVALPPDLIRRLTAAIGAAGGGLSTAGPDGTP
ncbi:MAG: anti-sigma factor family protein [Gemmatimonadales bacterium]